jgi:mannose-6-phosphate isomerase
MTMSPALADAAQIRDTLMNWLKNDAYPLWWGQGADHLQGGFHEKLGQDGEPVIAPRRARVQARQTYAYAVAKDAGWTGPGLEAMDHGLRFFLAHYRRPDGLFRTVVAPDGVCLDDHTPLYDQSFGLFALSAAYAASGRDPALEGVARKLITTLRDTRHNPLGGFEESVPRTLPLMANPHMHMLEACLAWSESSSDPIWAELVEEIVDLALTRFIDRDSGALKEFFDGSWAPVAGVNGRLVEPGHQFEWGWLLLRCAARRNDSAARAAAFRLIEIGEEHGVDAGRGVAINGLLDDFTVHDASARLWPQTERIKAGVLAALTTGEDRYWTMAANAARGLKKYLDVPVAGLWLDRFNADGTFIDEAAPASSFYHIVCGLLELDRGVRKASLDS